MSPWCERVQNICWMYLSVSEKQISYQYIIEVGTMVAVSSHHKNQYIIILLHEKDHYSLMRPLLSHGLYTIKLLYRR